MNSLTVPNIYHLMQQIEYDDKYRIAMFTGPGGFTQATMNKRQAEAIAKAFQIKFTVINSEKDIC